MDTHIRFRTSLESLQVFLSNLQGQHLRKDQSWRYEFLYTVDPITKTKIHQVRGKDGKILTPYQLEMELLLFKHAELVEIGQKPPFYDEYMSGVDYMASSSDNRAGYKFQSSVVFYHPLETSRY